MPMSAHADLWQSAEQALSAMVVTLPPPRAEDRTRLHRVGDVLYTPGILPRWGDELRGVGHVDGPLTTAAAAKAAELCVLNMLSLVRAELGSLDRVESISQISVLVRCEDSNCGYSRVADGASAALYRIFGEKGRHRREVIPTADLPEDAAVQISAILRVH